MFMWLQPSPCPDTTNLFSAEGQEILVDGVSRGEVCTKSEQEMLFHQHDAGFACVRSCGFPYGDLFEASGIIPRPLKGSKTLKMARPPHNSGSEVHQKNVEDL
jgi:hypothetical protein